METPIAPPLTAASGKRHWLLLSLGLGAVFAWLLWRNLGINPAIFADEWYYSQMARLKPLGEAIVPSYLYLWLFGFSSSCGTGFLDCVRIGNAVLFVGAGLFFYLIGRQVTRPALAAIVAVMCLLAPVNLYSALFMPEASYYFGFAVLSWLLLTRVEAGPVLLALGAGIVLGLMSLVKVHALFLIPAVGVYLIGLRGMRAPNSPWLLQGLAGAILMAAVTFGVKLGVGYLLAGAPALSIFGSFYDNTAASNGGRSLLSLASSVFINGRGHLMALAVLLPLPMALLLFLLLSSKARQAASPALRRLALFGFLALGATAGVTALYTASIAGVGPKEVIRLHLRYYSFTFPLLLLLAAGIWGTPGLDTLLKRGNKSRVLAALLVGAAAAAAVVMLPRYSLTEIDGPEIFGIDMRIWTGWAIVGLDLLILLLWSLGSRLAAPLFLFLALPSMLALGSEVTWNYLNQLRPGWAPDRGGVAAREYVPAQERKLITVAGDNVMDIMRAQFHIDDPHTGMLELARGAPIEPYQMPARHKWLLVIGDHALPGDLKPVLKTSEYALVKLNNVFSEIGRMHMSEPFGAGRLVVRAEGLSGAEPWGRWSDAKHVVLHFDRALPRELDVVIKARGYGVNATLPFTMRVGAQEAMFRVPGSDTEVRLRFQTDGLQRSLSIEVPRPTAPSSHSQLPDTRELGIGIAEIAIGDAADPAPAAATP